MPESIKASTADNRGKGVLRNRHFWYITALMLVFAIFYYMDVIIDHAGWVNFKWGVFYTVHDLHRSLFLIPVLYAAYIFRIKGVASTVFLLLLICLPRAIWVSPYPDPLFRAVIFIIGIGILGFLMAAFLNNLTERKKLEQELRQAQNEVLRETLYYLDSLINCANGPIMAWDREQKITIFNAAFERMTGYTSAEMLGKPLSLLFPENSREASLDSIRRTLLGRSWETEEIQILRKDGSTGLTLWNSANIYDRDGTMLLTTIAQGQDITQRMQAEELLRQSESKYSALVEQVNDGIIMIENGVLQFANNQVMQMTGFTRDEVLGRQFIDFTPPEARAGLTEMHLKRMSGQKVPSIYETIIIARNGQRIPVEINAAVTRYQGRPAVVALIRDIGERKLAEAKVIEMEALNRVNLAKSELLANVSHELRTPLASIKGFIETLIESDVEWSKEQQKEFLQSANREADRLTLLIKDLLDMSRLDSGKMVLDKGLYPAAEILDSVSGVLSEITKKHCLQVIKPLNLTLIKVDKIRIGQVITNLVENAAKFSAEGSLITIEVRPVDGEVIFSVEDQGIGMPPEVVASLFNRFYQAREVVYGKTRGTGLGLSICKGIVEAHGGKFRVESQPGRGSKLIFSIPADLPDKY